MRLYKKIVETIENNRKDLIQDSSELMNIFRPVLRKSTIRLVRLNCVTLSL
jgi:hypothetical protein